MQISNDLKSNYLFVHSVIMVRCKESYTQNELCGLLGVSRKKLSDFYQGKIVDFILLDQIAGLVCLDINITCNG